MINTWHTSMSLSCKQIMLFIYTPGFGIIYLYVPLSVRGDLYMSRMDSK